MVMTDDYRLVEQGGCTFRNIKRNELLSDLRRTAVYAWLAAAEVDC